MKYEIKSFIAKAEFIAAVHARVPRGRVGQYFGASLDKVWQFLRRNPGLRTDGHNFFLYHHVGCDAQFLSIDFGVQVVRSFEQQQDVCCVTTPAGEAVMALHRGSYDKLPAAHTAIHDWCRDNNRIIGDFSWEVYGDWNNDTSKLETTVVYLLR